VRLDLVLGELGEQADQPGAPAQIAPALDRRLSGQVALQRLVVLSHRWDKWHGLVGLARWR
jgi:hypothetical protein